MNLTDMLAMPLIQTQLARTLGTIVGFSLKGTTVTHYLAVDEQTFAPEDAYPFELVQVGADALCTLACPVTAPAARIPFRCAVYTEKGRLLGYLDDVNVAKDGHIVCIAVGDNVYNAARLVAIDDIVIVREKAETKEGGKTRRGRPRKKDVSAPDTTDVEEGVPIAEWQSETILTSAPTPIANRQQEKEKTAETPTVDTDTTETDTLGAENGLRRIISNYSFLLGRILGEDLTKEGQVLLAKGHVLTDADVAMAWQSGLLVPLTQLSRI